MRDNLRKSAGNDDDPSTIGSFTGRKVIISNKAAQTHGLKTGDTIKLDVNGSKVRFMICALAHPDGFFAEGGQALHMAVPRSTLSSIYGGYDNSNVLFVKLKDGVDINQSLEKLRNVYKHYEVGEPIPMEDIMEMSLEASILEAELKLLNSRLAKSYINGSEVVSDIPNGIVYDIGYVDGDIAGPQKKLLSIMSLGSLEIEADIPEEFYKDIKVGSKVIITPVADKARQYTGEISHISAKASDNNGETQIPVRIAIDEADDFLLPGFNVDASIMIDSQP